MRARQPSFWALSPRRASGIYVLVSLIVFFWVLKPVTFPTAETVKTILNQYSVTGLAALALIVPLSAGVFDLSIGATMGLSGMVAALLLSDTHLPLAFVIIVALAVGAGIGAVNALVVVGFKVNALIGTIATGGIVSAISVAVSGNTTVTSSRLSGELVPPFAAWNLDGFAIPVLYFVIIAVVLWFVLEQSPIGRAWYAIGFDAAAARLAGLRVAWLQCLTLVISGLISAFAGIVLAASVSSGTSDAGTPYLLPAFAIAFLGATQFREGRFNAAGTVLAVLLTGTANYGLLLAATPEWTPVVFNSAVLIIAVGVAGLERRGGRLRLPRRRRAETPTEPVTALEEVNGVQGP
jgi:ribose transport system permease protein